jgi:ubiquinone/menaquinone biosynthesis C-methylase UbiE
VHTPFYDGTIYSLVCDRMTRGLHQRVAAWVDEGSTCLDACCGSGGLTFQLAPRCRHVEGVDVSRPMVDRAERLRAKRAVSGVCFRMADVCRLDVFPDRAFDFATICLGLHEMPRQARLQVLPELLRVAGRVIVVDFAVPMPKNGAGIRNRIIEALAGRRHFRGFRDYMAQGGLSALVYASRAQVVRQRLLDRRTIVMAEVSDPR